ncbi:hypothetical protein KB20921_20240 [Edwardsiella ictaluri]|nr:Uncharacterised protein [Edwardsiella ictaluri]BEH99271.1 hypothetical protein KH20906_19990 [Edwardsiella ictaluri]BEI02763.1 hypothetical protein KB20921_20240 [Edwardsiella ictaluri]BEI06227.1 hypothetical protein KH201010_20130 [Edwardsiella ictaluri]BEI09686.1 hypothetical protein STU22726_20170 [Edwardsiella ictaluri]
MVEYSQYWITESTMHMPDTLFERGSTLTGETHDQKDEAVFGHFVVFGVPVYRASLDVFHVG